jgi:hypothetical protein
MLKVRSKKMMNEVQNQGGKELAERIKVDLAEIHHRFEISDPRYDATYRFYTAEAVTAKADEIGVTRFQGRTADGQVSQISKADGEWKRSDGKSLADIQAEIDKDSVASIKARAEQRAAAGHSVDAETDKQMALVDALDLRRIQNPDWQDKAAEKIAENSRANPNYKELESRKDNSPTNKPQENIIAINERSQEQDQTDKKKGKQDITQDIPNTVSNRYLRIEDKYYLPDKTVAFEDRGNNLKLETENHTVIRDALAIAETRGWQSISVSGSQNFKHQVWREASLKGMEVAGYKPTEFQMVELSKAMTLRDARKEVGDYPKQQDGVLRGVLLAHGPDHYKHDPNQGQSYFVKLDIEGKEVTRWGADLKRAFENSQTKPQIGDAVTLSNTGKQSVEIPNMALDDHGNVIEDKKTVKKNTWQVEKASQPETAQEQADALRVGKEIEHKVIEQMPQLAAALAVSKLGEKIAQRAKEIGALRSQDEVDTMVSLIREGLAAALEKGKHIKTPKIQEQGKNAALDSIINDHKPPEIVKEPQQQDMAMTR